MNKFYLIILQTLIFSSLTAQTVFCPAGAEWHYIFGKAFDASISNEKLKYERDSILSGDTVKVLKHTRYFRECNNVSESLTLLKVRNDSVLFRNSITFNQWQTLVNFGATSNQNWTFTIRNYDNTSLTYTVTVDSINNTLVNGISHKYLKVKYSVFNPFISGTTTYTATIFERFGDTHYLFNFFTKNAPGCDSDFTQEILCYSDSTSFGLKQFTVKPCDYSVTAIKENNNPLAIFKAYPTIVSDYLFISIKNESCYVKLFNIDGKLIINKKITNTNDLSNLNVTELVEGIYFLQMWDRNLLLGTQKIIVKR